MIRDRMPLRTDPLGLARIRHALNLSHAQMGKLLGLDDDGLDAGAETVRQIEAGQAPISRTLARLMATLEIALPGDATMHPRFLLAEDVPHLDLFVVHTRFPRFYARILSSGSPVDDGTFCHAVDEQEKIAIYRWHDDPDCLSEAALRQVLADTRDFVLQYRAANESEAFYSDAEEG